MPRRGVKKLTEWDYDDRNGTKLKIPVYQVPVPTYESGNPEETIALKVDIDELNIHEKDPDINALRDRVFAAVKAKHALKWEWFLYVRTYGSSDDTRRFIEADHINPSTSASVSLGVERIQIAVRPDGSKCWREAGRNYVHDGDPPVGDEHPGGYTRAIIPDTTEAREALGLIVGCFETIEERLRELLGPQQIEVAVREINRTGRVPGDFLPEPKPEKHDAETHDR